MAPPPRLTLSEWADLHRRLSPESSGEPGRWDTSRAEYQRGIMDAMTDPRVERVVLMTSARVGKTQCLNNLVGYHIHQDPGPIMVVLPTEARAEEWADDEFDPMVRDTPPLRGILGDRKSRALKQRRTHRIFPGGRLYMVGANAPSGLAAKTIRVVLADEVDRFPVSAGEEGDPVALAERRANTIWNRKIVLSSTPTIAGVSRIETAYLASDRRRFWVPCPDCGEMQTLKWAQVQPQDDPAAARYHCEGCGVGWTDAERWGAVSRGEWRAEGEFRGTAGFHLNELYSPWRRLAETVADFAASKATPARLKTWVNTALGETWQERGEAPDADRLLERREEWPAGTVPSGALCLTAGVDVQGDRIEAYVWAWGRRGLESWLVDREVLHGDPTQQSLWDGLYHGLLSREWKRADGRRMRVAKVAVDTGGVSTQSTYACLRKLRDPRLLLPVKGVDRWGTAAVTGPTHVDVTEGGRKLKRGLKLWLVSVSGLKAEFYRRLWLTRGDAEPPAGWVHLPQWADAETVRQLVAEELVTIKDKRGFSRQEWQRLRANEALDCAIYARAALYVLGADRRGDSFWDALETAPIEAGETAAAQAAPVAPVPVPAVVAAKQTERTRPAPRARFGPSW